MLVADIIFLLSLFAAKELKISAEYTISPYLTTTNRQIILDEIHKKEPIYIIYNARTFSLSFDKLYINLGILNTRNLEFFEYTTEQSIKNKIWHLGAGWKFEIISNFNIILLLAISYKEPLITHYKEAPNWDAKNESTIQGNNSNIGALPMIILNYDISKEQYINFSIKAFFGVNFSTDIEMKSIHHGTITIPGIFYVAGLGIAINT